MVVVVTEAIIGTIVVTRVVIVVVVVGVLVCLLLKSTIDPQETGCLWLRAGIIPLILLVLLMLQLLLGLLVPFYHQ
jgi:hypothetical protein